MYQVLLADDEPSVTASLKETVDWESLGLEVAACTASGREAMAVIQDMKIDIAILDIRMPGMSGLELCRILRQKQEDIQLIIISGYAEFAYAEEAISYGVLGYCLKPLEYGKVIKFLVKAVHNLEKSNHGMTGTDLLDALECGSTEAAERILQGFGFRGDAYYVAVTIGEGKLPVTADEGITVEFGRGQCGYICRNPLPAAASGFLESPDNRGIWYLTEPVTAAGLAAALDSCIVSAYQFFVEPERMIYPQTEDQKGKVTEEGREHKVNELLGTILQNVQKDRWDMVCDLLMLTELKYRKYFTVRSAIKLCNIVYTGSLFREEETDYYVYSIKQLVAEFGSLSGMLSRLKEEISNAVKTEDRQEVFSNTAFMKLMDYIGENYRGEISLNSAGAALNMNPSYVSQLFKKETGITFVHYVTQLRVEEAVNLLTTTKRPVIDIALESGFNDYFYFLKTFKRFTGKTPSQYREEGD